MCAARRTPGATLACMRKLALPAVLVLSLLPSAAAAGSHSYSRPATRAERRAIAATFAANDGSPSEIHAIYLARADARLAVVCVRTPEAGMQGYVFERARRGWRYVTSGRAGRAGDAADRRLEASCGR